MKVLEALESDGYDLSEFSEENINFIKALVKLAYNEGRVAGISEVRKLLAEPLEKLDEWRGDGDAAER